MTASCDSPLLLPTGRAKERFLYHLTASLSTAAGEPGGSQGSTEYGDNGVVSAVLIQAKDPVGPVLLSLRVLFCDDGSVVPEWSPEAAVRILQEGAWRESMARLDDPLPIYQWWAAIEPDDRYMPPSWYEYSNNSLGGLELRFEAPIVEWVPDRLRANATHSRFTAPWMLRGINEGINFYDAMPTAVRRLDEIAGLLSVVTGYSWRLRSGPEPVCSWPASVTHAPCDQDIWRPRKQMIGADLEHMLDHMKGSEVISGLILSFAHALRLRIEAPSLCFLAFAAIVERVGSSLRARKECGCCEKCTATFGAGAQFREGLFLADCSKTKARKLAQRLYEQRSTIAHSAALVGEESAYVANAIPPRIFDPPPGEAFVTSDLKLMQSLCRQVLLRVLCTSDLRDKVMASGVSS